MTTSGQLIALPPRRKTASSFDIDELLRVIKSQVRVMLKRWGIDTLDGRDEDDLTQDIAIFIAKDKAAILRKHDPSHGPMERFVRIIAISRMKDIHRRHRRRLALFPRPKVLSSENEPVMPGPKLDQSVEARDQLQCVRRCIERGFGPDYLQTFLLKVENDLSYREIAQTLGVTTHVVNNRIYEIRKHLAQCADTCGCQNQFRNATRKPRGHR